MVTFDIVGSALTLTFAEALTLSPLAPVAVTVQVTVSPTPALALLTVGLELVPMVLPPSSTHRTWSPFDCLHHLRCYRTKTLPVTTPLLGVIATLLRVGMRLFKSPNLRLSLPPFGSVMLGTGDAVPTLHGGLRSHSGLCPRCCSHCSTGRLWSKTDCRHHSPRQHFRRYRCKPCSG